MRKLTSTAVCNIRHAIMVEGQSSTSVAAKHSISPSTARAVARGDRYADIPSPCPIPQFENYLAYPNGKVWSTSSNRFIKATKKGTSNTKYYNLRNGKSRRSIPSKLVVSEVFG